MPYVLIVVAVATAFGVLSSRAGVTFRFDDVHPASQWRDVARQFEMRGVKATFAINPGKVTTEDQRLFLKTAVKNGHEIVDHTCSHSIFSHCCYNEDEFFALRSNPAVIGEERSEKRLNFRYEIRFDHPLNFSFRGSVTNGFLTVPIETARRFRRPDKIYVPSLRQAFGFYDSAEGRIRMYSFWKPSPVSLPDLADEEFVYVSRYAFCFPVEVLRFQCQRAREAFQRLGLPVPTAWAMPGGWDPWLTDVDFKKVYADEFGYVLGDAFVPIGAEVDRRLSPFHVRYQSYFDSPSVTQKTIRRDVLAARRKGAHLAFISHMKPPVGIAWEQWLRDTADFLDWLLMEKIPVLTASEVGRSLVR